MAEEQDKQKFSVERTYKVDAGYIEKFKELVSDLSIEVKKNFDRKKRDFFVRPRAPGTYPAILVIHDWWGMNDQVRMACLRLSKAGYVAQAISLFNGEETKRRDVAKLLMKDLSRSEGLRLIEESVHNLREMPFVNPRKIVVMGYLMGGYYALMTAARIRTLAGAIAFYGRFPRSVTDDLKKIAYPILLFSGHLADWLEAEEVNLIENKLAEYNKEHKVIRYEHAGQAFFDELHIKGYDYISAEDSWKLIMQYLKNAFKKTDPLQHPQLRHYFGKFGGRVIDSMEGSGLGSKLLDLFEDAIGDDEDRRQKRKSA